MPIAASALLAIATLANVIFGLAVFTRTYQKRYGRYFSLTILGIVLWAIGDAGLLFLRDPHIVHDMGEFFYIAPMITPLCMWLFALTFPEDNKPPRWLIPGMVIIFVLFAILLLTRLDWFIQPIAITRTFNVAVPKEPGFLFYSAYFSVFFCCSYFGFIGKIRKLRGTVRTQVGYIFWGLVTGSVLALLTNLSLPMVGVYDLVWMGPIFTLLFTGAVTAAIIRHRLFDVRLYAVRSAAYLLTLIVAAVLYVVPALLVSTRLLHATLSRSAVLFLVGVTLVVAFTFYPLKRFFDRITNTLFYRDVYNPQDFFNQLNQLLASTLDVDIILNGTVATIERYIKPDYCAITLMPHGVGRPKIVSSQGKTFSMAEFKRLHTGRLLMQHFPTVLNADMLPGNQETLKEAFAKNDIAIMASLGKGDGDSAHIGHIILGSKKSGNLYNRQDIRVLEAVANELVIAVQNALRFEEIENFNVTLQQKIADATHKLRRTNDKLRKLDQAKDDFISMASHQLRTPLTSMKGYVSMVLEGDAGKLTPLQKKLLNQAFISSQRMVYLISDLLNVSRLRTGKFVIEPVPTNLAAAVQEEVRQLASTARGRGLALTYDAPEHFPTLMLDDTKLRQVVMNFLDNAIYYTPAGGHITVNVVDTPQTIELTVTDDGIGVPRSEQPHLFTKFYRAHNAQRARPDGTGLGLFMAKKVVIAQGGSIIFRSREGKGSTFGFSLPKAKLQPAVRS